MFCKFRYWLDSSAINPFQTCFVLFIYLAFSMSGEGHCYRFSPITAGPFLQVCSGGGNSPQNRH